MIWVYLITVAIISWVRVGVSMELPTNLETAIMRIPTAAFAGLAGAYIWSLFDVIRRSQSVDLTPTDFNFTWLRLFLAPILSIVVGATLEGPLDLLVAFGIGTFPLTQLWRFTVARTRERLQIAGDTAPIEQPTLHHLQGLTRKTISRLEEEGISSAEHLAHADPVKLLLRTGFDWKMILDVRDQAILFNYIGKKIVNLRPIGIRGAIEVVDLGDSMDDVAPDEAEQLVNMIGS